MEKLIYKLTDEDDSGDDLEKDIKNLNTLFIEVISRKLSASDSDYTKVLVLNSLIRILAAFIPSLCHSTHEISSAGNMVAELLARRLNLHMQSKNLNKKQS